MMMKRMLLAVFAGVAMMTTAPGATAYDFPVGAADRKLEGRWVMHLYIGDRLFHDEVELKRDSEGRLHGTLTVPGRFTAGIPRVISSGNSFVFEITADEGHGPFRVRYEGSFYFGKGDDTFTGFGTVLGSKPEENELLGGFVGQRRP